MKRILSLKNISGSPITINGVLLANNDIYLSDSNNFAYWLTSGYLSLYESTSVEAILTDGTSLTYAIDGSEFTNAFLSTVNYYTVNQQLLTEILRPQGQITTTNNTTTTIYELPLPNGLTDFEILIKGHEVGTNNKYVGLFLPSVTVVTNVATLSPSFTTGGIVQRVGFAGSVGANGSTTANKLRVTVTGQTGRTILWTIKLNRIN